MQSLESGARACACRKNIKHTVCSKTGFLPGGLAPPVFLFSPPFTIPSFSGWCLFAPEFRLQRNAARVVWNERGENAWHHNSIIRKILIDLRLKMEEEGYRLGKFLLNLLEIHTWQVKCPSRTVSLSHPWHFPLPDFVLERHLVAKNQINSIGRKPSIPRPRAAGPK